MGDTIDHVWDFFSCCPDKHTFGKACLARHLTDALGVQREIVSAKDDDTFRVVTTWPSGEKSAPWTIDRDGWRMLWVYAQGSRPTITEPMITALKEWLGDEGHAFFNDCINRYGHAGPVLPPEGDRMPPHPVHFREGMQVRNLLRTLPDCEHWTDHDLDNHWEYVVFLAVKG